MTTLTNTNAGRCDGCYKNSDSRDADLCCPDCQYEMLVTTDAAIEATLDVVGAAIEQALNVVHPSDLRGLLDEKVAERVLRLNPARATVVARLEELRVAREAVSA